MPTLDPRIDAYIAAAPDFARPILVHLRALIHRACPDVVETIKWSRPHFEHHGMMCGMSAFSQHCGFGFWHPLLRGEADAAKASEASGQFGRITSLADLPGDDRLDAMIRRAARLNEEGTKPPPKPKAVKPPPATPADLAHALASSPSAQASFDAGSVTFRRDYIDWLDEAKTPATRDKRLAQTLEWLAEGKGRNWKYERR